MYTVIPRVVEHDFVVADRGRTPRVAQDDVGGSKPK